MRAALYARVSTHDQHTLTMQMDALQEFALRRGWTVTETVEEIASGAKDTRPKRQELLTAARGTAFGVPTLAGPRGRRARNVPPPKPTRARNS